MFKQALTITNPNGRSGQCAITREVISKS